MKELKVVPESTDIMVSHGPALGFGDNVRKNHFGSASLLHELAASFFEVYLKMQHKPKVPTTPFECSRVIQILEETV